MKARTPARGEFTGRHMLLAMLAFFGVIITVNVTMATLARKSWTGLVVQNSYVASQHFNEQAAAGRAQAALRWTADLSLADGVLSYGLVDPEGRTVPIAGATVQVRRPVNDAEDRTFTLERSHDGRVAGNAALADGAWLVEVHAEAGLAQPYRDVRRVQVAGGRFR